MRKVFSDRANLEITHKCVITYSLSHLDCHCSAYLDYIQSGKNPSLILEPQGASRLELASGIMARQVKHRSSITRKMLNIKATQTGKAADAMTWRLITRYFAQMRPRSSRSPWKLSDFSGRLIRP